MNIIYIIFICTQMPRGPSQPYSVLCLERNCIGI